MDPPYYNNVQYAELSNFFYVWLKRALHGVPGVEHLVREFLADRDREAVANGARFQQETEAELKEWEKQRDQLRQQYVANCGDKPSKGITAWRNKVKEANKRADTDVGQPPLNAGQRADRDYENKMAACFRRAKRLLHPRGRMVVMFNHKQTWAWRSLGMALIKAGFDIKSSVPIKTEAESSLNIRGQDAARSTVLMLCMPKEESQQPVGNWSAVQQSVNIVARKAAQMFAAQGLDGTDVYLSSLGPAIGVVSKNWPVTDFSGTQVDLQEALEAAYRAVGQWRLTQIFEKLDAAGEFVGVNTGFSADMVDADTQTLWLWLDTFKGSKADSDEVRKMAKSLNVNPDGFKQMGLISTEKQLFVLSSPLETDMKRVARRLKGLAGSSRQTSAREADIWEQREFPGFIGAAVWNAIAIMGGADGDHRGDSALRRWLIDSGTGSRTEFRFVFAVTLNLLEEAFKNSSEESSWGQTLQEASRAWDLVLSDWQV